MSKKDTAPDPDIIAELREQIEQYEALLKNLRNSPHPFMVVSDIKDDLVFLTGVNGGRSVARRKYIVIKDFEVGDWFEAVENNNAPLEKLPFLDIGRDAEVVRLSECGTSVTVKLHEQQAQVNCNPKLELRAGDTVRVDPQLTVVTMVITRAQQKASNVLDDPVQWDDIGGHSDAKLELIESIELPLQNPELFEKYGKRPPKGALMYGPPGCGKTMLGKAVATSLTKNTESPGCFIYVKGPELLNPYVGVSESNIRELFERARAYRAEYNAPAVIFIDEADALLSRRGKSHSTSRIEDTVVPMFLAEMDGLNHSDVMVLLATNRPDTLDPAVVRDGRIDRKVRISRPNEGDAAEIFKLYLSKVPINGEIDQIAKDIARDLYQVERNLFELHLENGGTAMFGLPQLASGALIEGVVEKATALAIRRELMEQGSDGVSMEDLVKAVDAVYMQNLDLNHHDAMEDFASPHVIKSVRKVAHVA